MYVCVCERLRGVRGCEREACVCERDIHACVCVCVRERESVCVCVRETCMACVSVCVRERERGVHVCVCV